MTDNTQPQQHDIPVEFQFRIRGQVNQLQDCVNMFDTLIENGQATTDEKSAFITAIEPFSRYVNQLNVEQNTSP